MRGAAAAVFAALATALFACGACGEAPPTWVVSQLTPDSELELGPGVKFSGLFGTGIFGKSLAGAYVPSLDAVLFVNGAQCNDEPPFVPKTFNGTHDVHRLFRVRPDDTDGSETGAWLSTEEEGAFVAEWPSNAPAPCCLRIQLIHGGPALPELLFLTGMCFASGNVAENGTMDTLNAPVATFMKLNVTSRAWTRIETPDLRDESAWTPEKPELPFHGHAMAVVDTVVYMHGGSVPGGYYTSQLDYAVYSQASMISYDVVRDEWALRRLPCGDPPNNFTAGWFKPHVPFGRPFVKSNGDACVPTYDDTDGAAFTGWCSPTVAGCFDTPSLPCIAAPFMYGHSMVYDPNRRALIVFGGLKSDLGVLLDFPTANSLAYVYDVDADVWTDAVDVGDESRFGLGAAVVVGNDTIAYLPGWRPLDTKFVVLDTRVGSYSQALLTAPLSEFPARAGWKVQPLVGMVGTAPLRPRTGAALASLPNGVLLVAGGERVAESEMHDDVTVMYVSEASAARSSAYLSVTRATAGQSVAVRAVVRDDAGRTLTHGRVVVTGYATHDGTGGTGPLTFAHVGGGVFEAGLYVTTVGEYNATVLVNGKVVPGGSLSVAVNAGTPVPGRCAAVGVRAAFGQASPAPNRFRVACLDRFNNAIELRPEDHNVTFALLPASLVSVAATVAVQLEARVLEGGFFEYVAPPGAYSGRLSVAGMPALPQPLQVNVEPPAWQLDAAEYAATRTVSLEPSRAAFRGLVALCALVAALAVVCGACSVKYRSVKVFKRAMPSFLGVMCVGIVLYMVGVIVELVATNASCAAAAWLEHLGFAMYFGALALKTYRLERVFSNEKLRKLRLSNGRLALMLGVAVAAVAVYLAVWTVVDTRGLATHSRAETVRGTNGTLTYTTLETAAVCRWGLWQLVLLAVEYVALILLSAFCLRVLEVDTDFNESRFIAFTVWNFVVLGGLLALVLVFWTDSVYSPDFYYGLRVAGTCIPSFMALALMFAPKVMRVYNGMGNRSAAEFRPRAFTVAGESLSSLPASGRVSISLMAAPNLSERSSLELRSISALAGSSRRQSEMR